MKRITYFLFLFILTSHVFAQKTSKKIEELLSAYAQNGKLNAAVLVADGKDILLKVAPYKKMFLILLALSVISYFFFKFWQSKKVPTAQN